MRNYNIGGVKILLEPCGGVYDPSDDTFLVIDNAQPHGSILEMGTGSGIISIFFSLKGFEVVGVDIDPRAVECAKSNANVNGCSAMFRQSDLFSAVPESFDTIIFNPPYLPTEDNFPGSGQWDGGSDGFKVIRPFLHKVTDHLRSGGNAFLVLSSFTEVDSLIREFSRLSFEKVSSVSFPFETLSLYRIVRN